jgi:hypothetical protein
MVEPEEAARTVEGEDAGPAEEFWANWHLQRVRSAHERASSLVEAAHEILSSSREEAQGLARQALVEAAHAYWFAEGTAGACAEHKYLHQIGRWTRQTFGCEFDWDGEIYRTSCPVKLADKRFGVSVGFTGRRMCSICNQEYWECPHYGDRLYWVRGGPTTFGPCRVCVEEGEVCEHSPGELYAAPVVRHWREKVLEEVSIVDVPANPLARPVDLEIETDALSRAVRKAFPDVPAFCGHCLRPYHGLPEPLNISGLEREDPSSGA